MLTPQKIQVLAKKSMNKIDPKHHKSYKDILKESPRLSFSGFGEDSPLLLALNASRGLQPVLC